MPALDMHDPATLSDALSLKLDPIRAANDALNAAIARQHGDKPNPDAVRDEMQAVRRVVADTIFDLWIWARLTVELDDDGGTFGVNLSGDEPAICEWGLSPEPAGALIDAIERTIERLDNHAKGAA